MSKILYYLACAVFLFTACKTIEDRDEMGALLTNDQIDIDVYATTTGGNQIVLINNTSGVAGTWDYVIDKSTRKQDTVLLPFLGTSTIFFTATTAGGLVEVTKDVTISQIDHPTDTTWDNLAGSTSEGKTWVWATDHPDGYAYGNGGYLGSTLPAWWKVDAATLDGWGVLNDEMTFDLNNAANFTLVTGNTASDGPTAGTHKGTFSFDMSVTKLLDGSTTTLWSIGQLTLTGATISRGYQPNTTDHELIYEFDILKLTDDELILACSEPDVSAWGTAWFWVFKRKGYTY
jgi:hypothetical protein